MNTPITEIYRCFFTLIDGISIHKFENELKNELLYQYLSRSLALDCRSMYIETDGEKRLIKISDLVEQTEEANNESINDTADNSDTTTITTTIEQQENSDLTTEGSENTENTKGNQKIFVFPYVIPETEKWIIAYGMVISWLSPKIYRERLLRESLGDRDYKESSHGNQLNVLIKLFEKAKNEVEDYRIDHSFDGFEGFN